jgi:TetR/AcrR family transcriptional regulator, cholesterol catabolism regulator
VNRRTPTQTIVAQLKQAVRQGLVDADSANRVIVQLRRAAPADAQEANGGRREHILRVAARVFSQKGYRATSLQEIADEVGVTRPSFYYHFKSKQEILAAIVDAALARAEAALDEVLAEEGSPVERLRAFVFKYVEINTEHAEIPILFQTMGELEPDAADAARRRRSAIDHKLARLIEEGVRSGDLEARRPLISAYGILGAVNWMHTWFRPDGELRAEEVAALLADLLLYGLAVDRRRPPD